MGTPPGALWAVQCGWLGKQNQFCSCHEVLLIFVHPQPQTPETASLKGCDSQGFWKLSKATGPQLYSQGKMIPTTWYHSPHRVDTKLAFGNLWVMFLVKRSTPELNDKLDEDKGRVPGFGV